MKNFFTLSILLVFLFGACADSASKQDKAAATLAEEITALEAQYSADPANAISKIGPLLEKYDAYIALPATDENTKVNYLLRAGEMASLMRNHQKSLDYYDRIVQEHPTSEKAPTALFMKGYTLDDKLKKFDEAKVVFELFLQKYPKDDFADDAQFLLDNLGKSEEEIIKAFEKAALREQ